MLKAGAKTLAFFAWEKHEAAARPDKPDKRMLAYERLSRKRNVFTKQSQKVSCRIQNLKKHSRKFQVNQKYKHTTKRNKKNKLNASAIHPLSVGVACCPHTQRGEEMEEKVNEKVIIISAKDLIKEKCIISYIESLTAEDMVSLVIEDPDRRLTDNILLAIASSDRIKNLEIKGNFRYKCVDGIAYSKSMVELIACPTGKTGKVMIPEGVRIIKARAFSKCKISAVKLPDSLVTIERSAFRGCRNLSEIDFGKGIKTLGSYSAEGIFANCNIQKLVLPPQIKAIGMAAFQNNNIQELLLPDGLEVIESNAFFNNPSLEEVTIPESVSKIKENAFPDVRKVHVKKYIPDLEFAITRSYVYGTATIETGGRELIIPKHPNAPIVMRSIIQNFIENERYEVPPTHDFARFAVERQETALQIFAKTKNENVKRYLKKNSKVIFKRLLQYGRNEEAVQMVQNDLMSKRTLKEILPEITEYPDVSAYILMKLNEDGQTKQKFVI